MSQPDSMNDTDNLSAFDLEDLIAGYRKGYLGGDEPAAPRSAAYLRGWQRGKVDGGHANPTAVHAAGPHVL